MDAFLLAASISMIGRHLIRIDDKNTDLLGANLRAVRADQCHISAADHNRLFSNLGRWNSKGNKETILDPSSLHVFQPSSRLEERTP